MKKIIAILLTIILAVSIFGGCADSNSNITPLTPVFANGVSPDYGDGDGQGENQDDTPTVDPVVPENQLPEGYASYKDAYVSFNYPKGMKKIDYYLRDTASGAEILVSPQAIKANEYDYTKNIYNDLNNDNYTEMCSEFISSSEDVFEFTYSNIYKNGFEITVVKYFDVNAQLLHEDEEGNSVEFYKGYARVFIENSAQPEFMEIVLTITADEYPAEYIPENYVNFSELVDAVVDSLVVVNG